MDILFLSIIILFFIGASMLLYKFVADSVEGEGSLGINFSLPNCPKCGEKVPAVRTPTSTNQTLWDGWTCSNCGCEIDKWGKEINTAKTVTAQKLIEEKQVDFVKPFDEKGKTPVEKVFDENNN